MVICLASVKLLFDPYLQRMYIILAKIMDLQDIVRLLKIFDYDIVQWIARLSRPCYLCRPTSSSVYAFIL